MRKLNVGHAPLPGIGDLYEMLLPSGVSIQVATQRSGRHHLSVNSPDATEPPVTAVLSRAEATGLATLLLGAHIEISEMDSPPRPPAPDIAQLPS